MGGRPRGRAWEECTAAKRAASRAAVGAGGGAGHRAVAIGKGDSGGGGLCPGLGKVGAQGFAEKPGDPGPVVGERGGGERAGGPGPRTVPRKSKGNDDSQTRG